MKISKDNHSFILKGGIKILEVKRDDFDESPEDILKTINNMLNGNITEKNKEENKEDNK